MKQMKRVLSFIMAVLMIVQLLPMNVLAEIAEEGAETYASDNLKRRTWSVDFQFDSIVQEREFS